MSDESKKKNHFNKDYLRTLEGKLLKKKEQKNQLKISDVRHDLDFEVYFKLLPSQIFNDFEETLADEVNQIEKMNLIFLKNLSENSTATIDNQQKEQSKEERAEQILLEKRKRNYAYHVLNYVLDMHTYFDFFSNDAFEIINISKSIVQDYQLQTVSSEIFLFSFLREKTEFSEFLKTYSVSDIRVSYLLSLALNEKTSFFTSSKKLKLKKGMIEFCFNKLNNLFSIQLKDTIFQSFNKLKSGFLKIYYKGTYKQKKKQTLQEQKIFSFFSGIQFSNEMHDILEKAAENAFLRFKTPVITSEILFITLMESKETNAGKILEYQFPLSLNWYLLRYQLLKRQYYQEIEIRSQIEKSQRFFTYLLKTQLSTQEFEKLSLDKSLQDVTTLFRNILIKNAMQVDFSNSLKNDIYEAIKTTSNRVYSESNL